MYILTTPTLESSWCIVKVQSDGSRQAMRVLDTLLDIVAHHVPYSSEEEDGEPTSGPGREVR